MCRAEPRWSAAATLLCAVCLANAFPQACSSEFDSSGVKRGACTNRRRDACGVRHDGGLQRVAKKTPLLRFINIWSQHKVIHAVAPPAGTTIAFIKESLFASASFSSSVVEITRKATQTFSFNPFHLHMCCYDSLHYLGRYAAALMTTKRTQLPVVYHNYRHQSEHLSNHNE